MSSFEKKFRAQPVTAPNTKEKSSETSKAANCRPPCLTGSELKAGVRPFRPPQNIALRTPPRIAMTILSIG